MRGGPARTAGLAVVALLLIAPLCPAQIPSQMNYQVMLTDDTDLPLADQSVELVFRIYDAESGGGQMWTETQNVVTNSIGAVSVVLGSVNPLGIDFSSPLWLEVEVDGELMSPRRPLTSAPYAQRALVADTAISAAHAITADDASELGGVPAADYALDDDLYQPGTINTPSNPLEWTKLKNVPGGFADGTDDVGTGVGGSGTANYVPKFTGATTLGSSAIYESGGQVMVGTTTPYGRVTVEDSGDRTALSVASTSDAGGWPVMLLERTADMTSGGSILALAATSGSASGLFVDCSIITPTGMYRPFWVDLDGGIYSIDEMEITSETDMVIDAYSYYDSDDTRVISGVYGPGGASGYDATGVYGESRPQDYYGFGGQFVGGWVGGRGLVEPTGDAEYFGLYGQVSGGGASSTNYGIYGTATGSGTNWAGYFLGDARVTGTFTNPGPLLEMDHPSDPENAYLRHALVASDEMKTVYDGTVELDAGGEATIQLPDWFEDLNADFRYQLTPVGGPAPSLHVAQAMSGGRFRVAGGEPGMTVCWQVTGVRHDPTALHRPLTVEEAKSARDHGRLLRPEAYGRSGIEAIGRPTEKQP